MSDQLELDDNEEVLTLNDGEGAEQTEDRGNDFTPSDDEPKAETDETKEQAETDKPEATTGEEGEGDAEAPSAKKPQHTIPKARFDEVNEERKFLRQQLEALMQRVGAPVAAPAAAPAAPAFDVDAKESEYTKALLDGEDAKAAQLRKEIRAYERAQAVREATEVVAQQHERAQFASAVQEIKARFPQLDDAKDTANTEAIEFVLWKRDTLIAKGKQAHVALREAAVAAAKTFKFDAPAAAPAAADPRKAEAATRNAKAANQQPAQLSGVGERATAPQRFDVNKMSEAEFESLSPDDLKRLRGD